MLGDVARRNRRVERRGEWTLLVVLLLLGVRAVGADAATITVTSLADDGPGSLREAFLAAAPSGDTIDFAVTGTITLTSGEIASIKSLTVSGPGPADLVISGNHVSRIFDFHGDTVTVSGVTIRDGRIDEPIGRGGGIVATAASVTISNCVFTGNFASAYGGAVAVHDPGHLRIVDTTMHDNTSAIHGGAIRSTAPTELERVTIIDNVAGSEGGAMIIEQTEIDIVDSTISGNRAQLEGGGLFLYASVGRITDTTIADNQGWAGGGVYVWGSATLVRTVLRHNSVQYGGGGLSISAPTPGGMLTVTDSTITENIADLAGIGAGVGDGGGILVQLPRVSIAGSTFSRNVAAGPAALDIHAAAVPDAFTIANSTFSGNISDAPAVSLGGGVPARLANVTIVADAAHGPGLGGSFVIRNSILADDQAYCLDGVSEGHNLVRHTSCPLGATDIGDVDPVLGPLQDHGGPTFTHRPLPGSPALDAGNPAVPGSGAPACEATDQRGAPRPQGTTCDIGAYEEGCGDGGPDVGEECDDGNLIDGDGCDSNCRVTGCGNGVATANTGEDCDDGNTLGGDCCDELCLFETAGSSCDDADVCDGVADQCDGAGACVGTDPLECDDDNLCTQDACDAVTGCSNIAAPATDCLLPGKVTFFVGNAADDAKDKIQWSWKKGGPVTQADLGNPHAATAYTLCLYDQDDTGAYAIAAALRVDASPLWKDLDPKGWKYKDKAGGADGVTQLQLKTSTPTKPSKGQVVLKAKGAQIPMPVPVAPDRYFHQSPYLYVQLVNSAGTCWSSRFASFQTRKHDGERFKASVP